jgi:subtilisin family serine protease
MAIEMDPSLQEVIDGPHDDLIEVIMKLRGSYAVPLGVQPISHFGPVITARVRRGDIRRVYSNVNVQAMKAPKLLETSETKYGGITSAKVNDIRRPPVPETGRGVIVGVVDWGFDITARSFRTLDGRTRIVALWDQRDGTPNGDATPYGYGRVHRREKIDRALNSPGPETTLGYRASDADSGSGSHGTHVAHIAAGTGSKILPEGLAPKADFIFVHLAAGSLSGLATLGDSVRLLEAVDFIRRESCGRAFVVNISVGRHGGPHTGLTLVEQALDAFLEEAPGRAIVMSTGNYFNSRAHACGRLIPGQSVELNWQTHASDVTPNELELWYRNTDRFYAKFYAPNRQVLASVPLGKNTEMVVDGIKIGKCYHRPYDSTSPDHHLNLFLYPGIPGGNWKLVLTGEEVSDGRWDAYVERDATCQGCQSVFVGPHVSKSGTTGSICNGRLTITVGAVDHTRLASDGLPELASFSSSGPVRDGRQKPDIVAPGVNIVSARSMSYDFPLGGVVRKSGASQAAPYVAGCLALIFEAAGRPLTIHETRAILMSTAKPLLRNRESVARSGAGFVDLAHALAATREYSYPRRPAQVVN